MKIKFIFITMTLLASFPAWSASDSVGVFLRAEKVVVLTKELSHNRLTGFMDAFHAGEKLFMDATTDGFKVVCRRDETKAACTFSFFPSPFVTIGPKRLQAEIPIQSLGTEVPSDFAMTFESSREDRCILELNNGSLKVLATKR